MIGGGDRLEIEVEIDELRRERTERAVFARLASRRPTAPVSTPPRSRMRWLAIAVPAAIAVAVAIAVIVVPRGRPKATIPSLVTTPVGGSSRFTLDDVVIDAGSDTAVSVARPTEDSTTLTLLRGVVDCEVPPRGDRPAFRVIAGDTIVEVVGTRFSVTRFADRVRVDVTHGLVAVVVDGERHMVAAGESWASAAWTAATAPQVPRPAAPKPTPAPPPRPVIAVVATHPEPATTPALSLAPVRPHTLSSRQAYAAAQRLELTDPGAAAVAYRKLARGSDRWAAMALLGFAEIEARRDAAVALRAIAELERRFPASSNAEDAAWLRVDIATARRHGHDDDVRRAAAAYLRKYPHGTYARQASRLARGL